MSHNFFVAFLYETYNKKSNFLKQVAVISIIVDHLGVCFYPNILDLELLEDWLSPFLLISFKPQ